MIICHEPRSTLLTTSKESSSTTPDGLFPFKKQHWFTLKRQGKMSRPKSGHGTSNQCHLKGKTRWGDLRFMKMRFQYMSSSCNFRILQQNISYDEHSAVAHAILLSSFIEHVFVCRTSIAQKMLCTLFFSQRAKTRQNDSKRNRLDSCDAMQPWLSDEQAANQCRLDPFSPSQRRGMWEVLANEGPVTWELKCLRSNCAPRPWRYSHN